LERLVTIRRRTPSGCNSLVVLVVIPLLILTALLIWALSNAGDDEDNGSLAQVPALEGADLEGSNVLVYGLTLNPSTFDPHRGAAFEIGIPFYSVYDTLVYRHPQNLTSFVPGLAERWEMAADGLSWTFYLRQDVKFHDGTAFDALSVAANLDRIMNPEIQSNKAKYLLGPYQSYTLIDKYTIQINLSEPYAPLLDGLSQVYLGMVSPQAVQNTTNNSYQFHQVGTGPYKLVDFIPGERIVLQRNEEYNWGPVFYAAAGPQSVDVIEFRFYPDAATRSLALESGEVDMIGELPPTDAELLVGKRDLRIYQVPIPGMPQQFFINTTHAPTDNQNFRQALIYGTNRTAIVDAVFQAQSPVANGPLSSITPFYNPAVEMLYGYDPEAARQLLAAVGYADSDADGIVEKDGLPLKLRLVFAPWNQMSDVAQLIQDQWRDIGIEVELILVADLPALRGYVESGEYDLIAFTDFGVDASLLNQYYLSDGAFNWSKYNDAELDQWLHDATRQQDLTQRGELYALAQQRIMEQAIVLPIREFVNLDGASTNLDGVIFSAQGWWPLLRNIQMEP